MGCRGRTSPILAVVGRFRDLNAHRERDVGSTTPKAARRFAHNDIGHDESSKTGLCLTMPRSRAVSSSVIESNTNL